MKKILKIIEYPGWNGISCLLTFIATFGLAGVIIGVGSKLIDKSKELANFLFEPVTLPKLYLIIGTIVLIGAVVTISRTEIVQYRKRKSRESTKVQQGKFFLIWKVFWLLEFTFYDGQYVEGPYCPTHRLAMDVGYHEEKFAFRCKGNKQGEMHIFEGPTYEELIVPTQGAGGIHEALLHDVKERILAEIRKQDNH